MAAQVIHTMPKPELNELINYWTLFIPVQPTGFTRTSCKAAVILALIGSILPEILPPLVCQDVASSLVVIIMDPVKNPYRLLAIELLGLVFKTWEPFLNAPAVLRTLFNLTGFNGPTSAGNAALASPSNMLMARQALLAIAETQTALFINTLTFDLIHATSFSQRVGCLKLLGIFITKVILVKLAICTTIPAFIGISGIHGQGSRSE